MIELLAISAGTLIGLLLIAVLIGRLFKDRRTRRCIFIGAIAVYVVIAVSYFGFIALVMGGNLNRGTH